MLDTHAFLFVTGLHRSGTSLLQHCMRQHRQISGFANKGVSEDEGQHHVEEIDAVINERYLAQWRGMLSDPGNQRAIEEAFLLEARIQQFGYSLRDWSVSQPLHARWRR